MELASPEPARDEVGNRRARLWARPWAVVGGLAGALLLAGCQVPSFGAYHGATRQGNDAFKLWQGFFIAGLVVGGVVLVLIVYASLRYRKRSDDIPFQSQYHTLFEITYTVVPIIIVLVLFGFTVVTENKVDATPPARVNVTVTAFQWGWEFYYPQTGKTVIGETTEDPEMVLPVGQDAAVTLKSDDVIHDFYVPEFNFGRYALPGVINHFNLDVTHLGTFRGQCSEFCGLYHSLMFFRVKSVPEAQYNSWVHQVTGSKTINQLKAQIRAKGPGA